MRIHPGTLELQGGSPDFCSQVSQRGNTDCTPIYLRDSSFALSSCLFSLISRCTFSSISRNWCSSGTIQSETIGTDLFFFSAQLFFLEAHTLGSEFFRLDRYIAKTSRIKSCPYTTPKRRTVCLYAHFGKASLYGMSHTRDHESTTSNQQDGSCSVCWVSFHQNHNKKINWLEKRAPQPAKIRMFWVVNLGNTPRVDAGSN